MQAFYNVPKRHIELKVTHCVELRLNRDNSIFYKRPLKWKLNTGIFLNPYCQKLNASEEPNFKLITSLYEDSCLLSLIGNDNF